MFFREERYYQDKLKCKLLLFIQKIKKFIKEKLYQKVTNQFVCQKKKIEMGPGIVVQSAEQVRLITGSCVKS